MSTLLYRIGKLANRRPWWFVAGWAVVLGVIVSLLIANPVKLSSDISIDGTPSQNVIDSLATKLPDAAGGQGAIAFQTQPGTRVDSPANTAAIEAAVNRTYSTKHVIDARKVMADELAKGSGSRTLAYAGAIAGANGASAAQPGQPTPLIVAGAQLPGVTVSGDGRVALFQFQFDEQTYELPSSTIPGIIDHAKKATAHHDLAVLPSSAMLAIPDLIGVGEIVGVAVAAIVLIITLGSVVAGGLPLVTALVGLATGVGGAFTLSHLIQIPSLAAVLAIMLGLAVGIDYALFIVNRQRRLIIDQGLTAAEAAARAIGTAGSAVFFAGSTVIIALVALLLVNIQILTTMALIAAATVALAVLVALTLLPALLGLVGERVCSVKARASGRPQEESALPRRHGLAERWSSLVTKRPIVALVGSLLIAALLALPALDMKLGLPSGTNYSPGTAQRESYDAVSRSLGAGYNGPLVVVADSTDNTAISPADVVELDKNLRALDNVQSVSFAGTNDAGTTVVLSVIPSTGPTAAGTEKLVTDIRNHSNQLAGNSNVAVGLTGFTALEIDVSKKLADVLPSYVGTVLILSLLVLLLVFRSIVVPIKATLGFILSLFATLGATTAVFQWGWLQPALGMNATAPLLSLLPIILTGVLYGLAMDYEVFLVSSMREAHVHGHHGRESVSYGFRQASRVVTGAAIIMVSVFSGFVFNGDPMIKQVGFALAVGILVDAFLVRMTFVPAIMAIFGDSAWWLPRWLSRLLPNLDVEGDRLLTKLRADHPVELPGDPR